jgi:hypothetical protein
VRQQRLLKSEALTSGIITTAKSWNRDLIVVLLQTFLQWPVDFRHRWWWDVPLAFGALWSLGAAVSAMVSCAIGSHRGLRKEALWAMSSLAGAPSRDGIAALEAAGALPVLLDALRAGASDLRKEAGFAVANVCAGAPARCLITPRNRGSAGDGISCGRLCDLSIIGCLCDLSCIGCLCDLSFIGCLCDLSIIGCRPRGLPPRVVCCGRACGIARRVQ